MQNLKAVVEQILGRIEVVRGKGEEATKQALVLPMVSALGYDIWNPAEVCPEYAADFAIRKAGQKEKVDLAVLLNEQPRIYFEVKDISQSLDGHQGQLARYFNATTTVSLAVLTNGLEYRFFTDSEELNIMDSEPFYVARLDAPDPGFDVIARFQKSVFSHEAIRDFATELNYRSKMVAFLRREIDLRDREPSDGLVRWVLASDRMYDSRVTANVVERMSPIVKNALAIVLREIVRRSLAAIDQQVSTADDEVGESADGPNEVGETELAEYPADGAGSDDSGKTMSASQICTTEDELQYFAEVKAIFEGSPWSDQPIFDPSAGRHVPMEIAYKDTTGYFGIYFNKPSWWIVRIVAGAKKPWIGFNLDSSIFGGLLPNGITAISPSPWASCRVGISCPADIVALRTVLLAAFEKTILDRERAAEVASR